MKTPIQELIETFEEMRSPIDSKVDVDFAISLMKSMLEKEKEMMCEFAFNCGDEIKDQNNWRSPRNLTNYEVIQDFYNETFNTKEK
jgi:hypothetical protein